MTGHIKYGRSVESVVNTSDSDMYGVAKQVGEHVNLRSRRTDVTAVVSATAGMGAPACFIPSLAEVHLNTSIVAVGDPEKVNYKDTMWQLDHAPAVGAMDHEAAHARHTKFDPRELMEEHGATRKMIDVITTLEEPRIEYNSIRHNPATRPFLRGCAMEIVGRDFTIPNTAYGAAAAAGLLLARVDAGVLTKAEARGFRKEIKAVLGDTLDELEPLWQRFLRLHDEDYDGMVEVAREWLEALHEDEDSTEDMVAMILMGEPLPGDEGEGDSEGEGEGGSGGEGEGEGDEGEGSGSGFGAIIMAGVREAETNMDGEIVEKRGDERSARKAAERKADAGRRKESEAPHAEAFGTPGGHGFGSGGDSHLIGTRQPTADERRAARQLGALLEKIEYHDRVVSKVASVVPPGRLRGRVAVQGAAAESMGIEYEGAPWMGKRRRRVETIKLKAGLLVDISGSMNSAMKPLASTQWVLSTAGAHIDAEVASVHFGESVHGVLRAGVKEREVREFYPGDGFEAFKDAALAMDKELHLLDSTGARMLFIISDGVFVSDDHMHYASTFIPLAMRKGVAVMFLDFTGGMGYGSYGAPVIDCQGLDPVDVARVVGKAAVEEMKRLDRRTA